MRSAFFGRNKKFNTVGEENEADLVVVTNRAEGEQTGDLRRQLTLGLGNAPEISGGADVNNEHDGKLAFFGKFFHKRGAHARRHIPVDRADLVPRLIFAHVFKIHPAPFEHAVVIAGEGGLDQAACFYFESADFFKNLGCRLRAPTSVIPSGAKRSRGSPLD